MTASGSISLAEEAGVNLLANLAAFRAWAGAADVAAAKALCHNDQLPDLATQPRPRVMYYGDPDGRGFQMEAIAGGYGYQWTQRGEFRALLEREVPEAYQADVAAAERDLKNHLGAIVDEIRDLAGSGDACAPLNVIKIEVYGPWRFDDNWEETELGQIQRAGLILTWES